MSEKRIENNLRAVREQLNMSSSEIARQLGVSKSTIYDMEKRLLNDQLIFEYFAYLQGQGASLEEMLLAKGEKKAKRKKFLTKS